jgi:hypothetical protein
VNTPDAKTATGPDTPVQELEPRRYVISREASAAWREAATVVDDDDLHANWIEMDLVVLHTAMLEIEGEAHFGQKMRAALALAFESMEHIRETAGHMRRCKMFPDSKFPVEPEATP